MKESKKLIFLLLLLPVLFIYTGCSKDDDPGTNPPPAVNESEVLIKYLEANGDFINTLAPAMISASDVRTNQLSGASQFIIDIRSSADFQNKGHIEGAVNVQIKDVVNYYKANNLQTYDKVVIACYSGQSAAFTASLLRLLGYNNVFDLKFGMSSWNKDIADSWMPKLSNSRASEFVTTPTAKNTIGNLPVLNTGKTTGPEILEARVNQLLNDGFSAITVDNNAVFSNLSSYYIVNYWPQAHYDLGHIPGAIQYTPKADLKLDTNLKTLPTDKPVVIYCYTGQTSGFVAAYLKLIGYDAKTLLFGCNAMIYDLMVANNLTVFKDTDIMGYPYVTGP